MSPVPLDMDSGDGGGWPKELDPGEGDHHMKRLGLYDVGYADRLVVLCDDCAEEANRAGWMPELCERGGWLIDEQCDRCGVNNTREDEQ